MSCIHAIPYCSAIRRSTVVNPDTCYSGNGLQKYFAKSGVSAICFSLKSQVVNILWCVGHRTSVAAPQLHCCSVKAARQYGVWLCSVWLRSNKFYLQKHVAY